MSTTDGVGISFANILKKPLKLLMGRDGVSTSTPNTTNGAAARNATISKKPVPSSPNVGISFATEG